MSVLLSSVGLLQYLTSRSDDDAIDRLHNYMTSNLLLALALLTSYKQFGGNPVECMVPSMFADSWEEYAENYCWSKDTYYMPFDEIVPAEDEKRAENEISYYQWVPFFLLFEAACFRLPSLIWKYMAGHSGIKIHDIVKVATDPKNIRVEGRKDTLHSLTTHLQNALRFHRRAYKRQVIPAHLALVNLPYTASFVTIIYLFVKCLYFANTFFQLWLMNKFLGTNNYSFYGLDALRDILSGKNWEKSGFFPRVTMCDFKVRSMGSNVQRFSVQCVLVINIFNEKIFIFLWFWYTMLMVLTAASIVYWAVIMVIPYFSRSFVSRHLELSELPFDPDGSRKDVERFVSGYLKTDGVFILRMITVHAGIIFATDLVLNLWKIFYGIEETHRKLTGLTPTPEDEKKRMMLVLANKSMEENAENQLVDRSKGGRKAVLMHQQAADEDDGGSGDVDSDEGKTKSKDDDGDMGLFDIVIQPQSAQLTSGAGNIGDDDSSDDDQGDDDDDECNVGTLDKNRNRWKRRYR